MSRATTLLSITLALAVAFAAALAISEGFGHIAAAMRVVG